MKLPISKKNVVLYLFLAGIGLLGLNLFIEMENDSTDGQIKGEIFSVNIFLDSTDIHFKPLNKVGNEFEENIQILNNLCEKLSIIHEFNYKGITHIDAKNEKSVRDFFNKIESERIDQINIFICSKENTFSTGWRSPFFSGITPINAINDPCEGGAYGQGNFISLPFNHRHEIATLLHEITHKIVGGNEIHIGASNQVDTCHLLKENGCINLMGENYVVPYSFLLTSSQIENINAQRKCSPCTSLHTFPRDIIGEKIESEVVCCPDLKFKMHRDTVRKLIRDISEDDITIVMRAIQVMLSHNVCPSQITNEEIPKIVDLILNDANCKALKGILKKVLCSPVDRFRIRGAIIIAARVYRQLYLTSGYFRKMTRGEADYLAMSNNKLSDHYFEHKMNFVKLIFNEQQEVIELEMISQLAALTLDDEMELLDLNDSIKIMTSKVDQLREDVGILKYRNDQYVENNTLLVNYDIFKDSIKNSRKRFFRNKSKLTTLLMRQAAIQNRIEQRRKYGIQNEGDVAYDYRVMDTKIGA